VRCGFICSATSVIRVACAFDEANPVCPSFFPDENIAAEMVPFTAVLKLDQYEPYKSKTVAFVLGASLSNSPTDRWSRRPRAFGSPRATESTESFEKEEVKEVSNSCVA
jgi:hypothetical protein